MKYNGDETPKTELSDKVFPIAENDFEDWILIRLSENHIGDLLANARVKI